MESPFDLTGKVALVTGANSGIGLGFAQALANAGATLVIWGRNGKANDRAAAELTSGGHRVLAQSVDVADEYQVVDAIHSAVAELGHIDCVVANAGISTPQPSFLDMTSEAYHELLAINQHGAYYTIREGLRHMVERGAGGSIVVCGSLANRLGIPRLAHYAAAKGALATMVRSVAVEYAARHIRINMVLPGRILTSLGGPGHGNPDELAARVAGIPAGRIGTPEDLGGIVVYLASDASRFHTGDMITIDGGQSLAT